MVALLRNEAFPLPQRLTYLCLTVLMAQAGVKAGQTMRAPVEEIAELVGVSEAEVRGYLAEAAVLGLLEVEERVVAGGDMASRPIVANNDIPQEAHPWTR